MSDNRDQRRNLATAATGGSLLASGGVLRHHAVRRSYPDVKRQPKIHALAMLRKAPKGKKQFWAGTSLGLIGLPALAVGSTNAVQAARVQKADEEKKRSFWREGLSGTKDALGQRAQTVSQPVPGKLRAAQLAAGAGAGGLGALAARAALGRRGNALKPIITPVVGGLAATASVPLTNKAVRRRYPDYEVTAAGVRRKKKPIVRPTKMASHYQPQPRSLRQDMSKSFMGGVYKPVTALTRTERGALRHSARTNMRVKQGPIHQRGTPAYNHPDSKELHEFLPKTSEASSHRHIRFAPNVSARHRAMVLRAAPKKLKRPIVVMHSADQPTHATVGRGNRPAHIIISGQAERVGFGMDEHIFRHELAHSQVKRKLSRGATFRQHPLKGAREEARADAAAQRAFPGRGPSADYERAAILHRNRGHRGIKRVMRRVAPALNEHVLLQRPQALEYARHRAKLGSPIHGRKHIPGASWLSQDEKDMAVAGGTAAAVGGVALAAQHHKNRQRKRSRRISAVEKAETKDKRYLGARTPYIKQRATISASTHTPVIGPVVSAAAAARYAPPGQERKQAVRQWALSSGVGVPAGIAGAYGGAHLANKSPKFERVAGKVIGGQAAVHNKARKLVGLKKHPADHQGKVTRKIVGSRFGKPFRTKAGLVGGLAGGMIGRAAAGVPGDQMAITLNQRDQTRYNREHNIHKAELPNVTWPLTHEKALEHLVEHHNVPRGRRFADLPMSNHPLYKDPLTAHQTMHSTDAEGQKAWEHHHVHLRPVKGGKVEKFLTSPSTKKDRKELAHRKRLSAALSLTSGTAGLAGMGLLAAKKRNLALTSSTIAGGVGGLNSLLGSKVQRQEAKAIDPVKKAAPLAIQGNRAEHADYIRRYGDRGPLPKNLPREERMKAYEARYVHHGGDKANKWSRRAGTGTTLKNTGLAVATGGGAAWLATRGRRGGKLLAKHPHLARHAETTAVAGATLGGAGEMLAGYAHHRQSSYANSPGGVAASALRRMRDYTPTEPA